MENSMKKKEENMKETKALIQTIPWSSIWTKNPLLHQTLGFNKFHTSSTKANLKLKFSQIC